MTLCYTVRPVPFVQDITVLVTHIETGNVLDLHTAGIWFGSWLLYLLYLLTQCSRVLFEKLTGSQLVKKFTAFYGTRRFITAFTSGRHLSLSWAIPPHPTTCRFILILSFHLRLGLPNSLFPTGFPTKTLYTPLLSPIRAICPAHLILLDFITRTILGEQYRSFSSSLRSFLHSPVTSFLLGPNILLSTLFSNTLSLRVNGYSRFNRRSVGRQGWVHLPATLSNFFRHFISFILNKRVTEISLFSSLNNLSTLCNVD